MDTWLEWGGTLFGLLAVALTARQRILCWPLGLVSVAAFALLFFRIRLYSDAALQIFYIGTGIYGWWAWARGGVNGGELALSALRPKARWLGALALGSGIVIGGYAMDTYTDADLPYWDMATTLMSIVAQVMLMRKILDNWVVWILVDVLSIGIYISKGVYVTAGLYAVFLGLATWGLTLWLKELRTDARIHGVEAESGDRPLVARGALL